MAETYFWHHFQSILNKSQQFVVQRIMAINLADFS